MIRLPTLSAAVAFFALAALPVPGAAQTGPCGPDGHTQTCLLEEAMILSGQRKRGVGDIQDMLAIAAVAEASGRVDMSAFAPRFFARLEDRYPYGPVLLDLLDAKVCLGHGRGIGPVLATQMARRIPMLEREVTAEDRRILGKDFDRLHVVAVCLALAGDIDGLHALIAAHPGRASSLAGGAANRLMWLGEREAARDLMGPTIWRLGRIKS
ncbi:hypothetical protein [Jannaschia donghaensis]|uniref:Uncharacterized protein n=1 Tax=Jannaschia donghaensis TaxID=420998 RepID=A0A0M6YHE5_9RHOB|nr:hypothetical protein [Jannaschia donghaensis]CTQ49778.1 hypothetical protein JDO7802_01795 [Jannaschia donghaensis]